MAKKQVKAKSRNIFLNSKPKIITAGIIAVALLLVVIFLIIREGSYGKLIIKNNTDLNLEYVKTSFVNEDGIVDNGLQTGKVAAGDKLTSDLEPVDLENTESNLELAFKLSGYDEMFTDVGYFNQKFIGNIKVTFNKTDDPDIIIIKIKAANGLFQTKNIYCDEEYEIDLKEGIILD